MASVASDDTSLPPLTRPPTANASVETPTDTTPEGCTAVNMVDTETLVSSITTVSTADTSTTLNTRLSHPDYAILNGGRRKKLENLYYRIKLIGTILELSPSYYLPLILSNQNTVKLDIWGLPLKNKWCVDVSSKYKYKVSDYK